MVSLECKRGGQFGAESGDHIPAEFGGHFQRNVQRDELTHPKSLESIQADKGLFLDIHAFAQEYVNFVSSIMQEVGVKATLPFK